MKARKLSHKLVDKAFRDKNGHIAILQTPNVPLWIWIVSTASGWFIHGQPKTIVGLIGSLALFMWALLETGWGSSWFRKLLGIIVLLAMVLGLVTKYLR